MSILLTNAILLDLDPIGVESADLRLDGGLIAQRGKLQPSPGEEVIDCGGAVVLPGLVNGHTHLYSALAVGMPPPPRPPADFHEILKLVWWRLDRALDAESIELSAAIGAMDSLHCGVTTLIDHHSSPSCIDGSLDRIERSLNMVGLRGVLCYETTDRNGRAGREAGLEENRQYIARCHATRSARFAALSGAHASFTLDDLSLVGITQWADEFNVGAHIHVAEDPCDDLITRQRYKMPLIERLARNELLGPQHVLAHCIHLGDDAIDQLNEAQVTVAHNPRSNMNNAVGYAPLAKLRCPVMLGTDGIGGDMLAEARCAWLKSRDARAGKSPGEIVQMLANSARRASRSLGITLGQLHVGAAADVVITDCVPFSPLTSDNAAAHLLFGLDSRHVRHVFVDGRCILNERRVVGCAEHDLRRQALTISRDLWQRMKRIDV